MRYRFYKTRGVDTFWAVRLTRTKTPKMVPGHPNCAYGIRPEFAHTANTTYRGGIIDLSTIHDYTDRCPKKEALAGMGEYGYLVTQTGLQFRHSISSGVYAVTRLSNNQPVVSGVHSDKILVYRRVAGAVHTSTP